MMVKDAEFVLLHSTKSNNQTLVADFFDYDLKVAVNARIKTKNSSDVTTTGSSGMKSMDTITLDFDGDKFDDIVYVNQNNNKGITITVPVFDRRTLITNSSQSIIVSNAASSGYVPRFRLGKADFDLDGKDELVFAFRNFATEKATIQIYKIGTNNIPVLQAEIADVSFGFLGGSWEEDVYDITVNDFDGDLVPDIALANMANVGSNNDFKLYTYSVNTSETWSIIAKGSVVIGSGGNINNYKVMALSSGLYTVRNKNQRQISLAVAYIDPADNLKVKRQLYVASAPSFKDQG